MGACFLRSTRPPLLGTGRRPASLGPASVANAPEDSSGRARTRRLPTPYPGPTEGYHGRGGPACRHKHLALCERATTVPPESTQTSATMRGCTTIGARWTAGTERVDPG